MNELQELLDWLDSFEKLQFEPTRQNVIEKVWQLQSKIRRTEFKKAQEGLHFHSQNGYEEAKKWLIEIGEWDRVSTTGSSTDGWSIVATANVLWDKQKK